ncbi:MAG: ABC transporter ATP-binding protein [Anaerolineales bacterium]
MIRLTADRVAFAYNGHPVISDLSLTVAEGEMLGLIGPNGAGKTTVLRALAGQHAPGAGVVLLEGKNVRGLSSLARARRIGLVPQGESLAWPLTVEEIVALGRAAHRGWLLPLSAIDRDVIVWALARTHLTELRDRPVDKLSGGERQRTLIARALTQQPAVLLLDEPTANLDIHHQLQVLDLVRELVAAGKLAAVLAIHDLTLAARYCDRLVLLHAGHAIASGLPEAVLTSDNLRAVFDVQAELYRNPFGQWSLSVQSLKEESPWPASLPRPT